MQIQPTISAPLTANAQGVTLGNSSNGEKPVEDLRIDWSVRMNLRHAQGFVGGAGRLLIQNTGGDDKHEIILLLPAAMADRPGRLELASAVVCSGKPGLPIQPGQSLAYRSESAKAILTIPVLRPNDWLYIDLTWTGGFQPGGTVYAGGQVPVGEYHPQVATEVQRSDGQTGIAPSRRARYEVELGTDLGATVRLETEDSGRVVTRPGDDPEMSIHEFKSFGKAHIQALLAPPGAVTGPAFAPAAAPAALPAGQVPSMDPAGVTYGP